MQNLPHPFDDAALQNELSDILVRYGVDDRVMHAVLARLAEAINRRA